MLLVALSALSSRCWPGQPAVGPSPAPRAESGQAAPAADLLATLRSAILTEVQIGEGNLSGAVAGLNRRLESEPAPVGSIRLRLDASLTPRIDPYYAAYVSTYDIRQGFYARRMPLEHVAKMLADMSGASWRVEKQGVTFYDPQGPRDVRLDFRSVRAIRINRGFPNAEKIWDELVGLGASLRDEDWFGSFRGDGWEIWIAPDVEVKAAQGILAACVRRCPDAMSRVCVVLDPGNMDAQRVMIGPLIQAPARPMRGAIERLLEPGLSRSAFHELLAPHK